MQRPYISAEGSPSRYTFSNSSCFLRFFGCGKVGPTISSSSSSSSITSSALLRGTSSASVLSSGAPMIEREASQRVSEQKCSQADNWELCRRTNLLSNLICYYIKGQKGCWSLPLFRASMDFRDLRNLPGWLFFPLLMRLGKRAEVLEGRQTQQRKLGRRSNGSCCTAYVAS
jgi:hypothetical protein